MTDSGTNLDWLEQAWGNDPIPAPGTGAPRAHARDCAVETGPGELPQPVPSLSSLTGQARLWATQRLVPAVTTAAEKKGTLLHAQPPTFAQALARHRQCAAHYDNRLAGGGRMLFGYVHTLTVKPALNYLEWATASPLSLVIHALIGGVVWAALLAGGYL
jgi:hypothetical protein